MSLMPIMQAPVSPATLNASTEGTAFDVKNFTANLNNLVHELVKICLSTEQVKLRLELMRICRFTKTQNR